MKRSITPNQIKQNNRNLIYHYIYKNGKVSQQDISYDLRLSRPTVTANLTAMETDGLIQKCGSIDTEFVGRKAAAYSVIPDYRVSIGVEILKKEIKIIAVDLYGEKIRRIAHDIAYEYKDAYFKTVCDKILEFKHMLHITDKQLLGIGFAMQGLVSPDRQTVLYGEILSCTGLPIGVFTRHLSYPCSFIHDADSAAIAELWVSPELSDAFYLSISKHLGAAMISKGQILTGKHGHNSTIEHIQMKPDGALCYCGKRGCMETLCSLNALLSENESLDDFFARVRRNDTSARNRWTAFLTELAKAVNLLHLIYDTDFILGGYLAPYLCEEDIAFLHEQIRQLTPFAEESDFLLISKMPKHNITIGAALPYIQNFLNTLSEPT
ncbi:ROK family transcriptional regulator [Lachnospiraceae bacterium MD308]|nr:ROK family transcriptional regulator [Lachnospiraceae bacterium MD308]MCI8579140.1 ROK family transcriptional regulator [Dorea sp.]